MQKEIQLAAFAVLALTGVSSAQTAIVNIDLNGNSIVGDPAGPTGGNLAGVIGNADGSNTWNPVGDTTLQSSLLNKDGVPTGLTFQLTGTLGLVANAGEFEFNYVFPVNVQNVFFETYAHISGGSLGLDTSSFTLGGFAEGETADLYFYATWPWADTGAEFRLSSDGGSTWTGWQLVDGTPSEANAAFDEGSSYTLFEDVAPHTDGTILGEWRSIEGTDTGGVKHRGMFNALQIEGIFVDPPPSAPLSITSVSYDAGNITLEVTGPAGATYNVTASGDLLDGFPDIVETVTMDEFGAGSVGPFAGIGDAEYYRLEEQEP